MKHDLIFVYLVYVMTCVVLICTCVYLYDQGEHAINIRNIIKISIGLNIIFLIDLLIRFVKSWD